MSNYKRIKIFRLLYGATIVTALVIGIGIARESYVWPLIGFIASIIAFIAYSDALLRCPHCHSRKAMDMVRIRAIRPGFEFYCPMCGQNRGAVLLLLLSVHNSNHILIKFVNELNENGRKNLACR